MKSFSIFLFFYLTHSFFTPSFAQITKKNWLLGGTGTVYSYKETFTSSNTNFIANYTDIAMSASVGYFFIDKFSAGLRPIFSSFKGESQGGGSSNNYRLALGPFARYYFLNSEKPFNILADVGYQIGINKDIAGFSEQGKFNMFALMGGTEVFLNNSVGFEILVGYTQRITSIENSPNARTSNKKGFQTAIGFTLHLEKY